MFFSGALGRSFVLLSCIKYHSMSLVLSYALPQAKHVVKHRPCSINALLYVGCSINAVLYSAPTPECRGS